MQTDQPSPANPTRSEERDMLRQIQRRDWERHTTQDDAAWDHIVPCALNGSHLHLDTLILLRDTSQAEFARVLGRASQQQRRDLAAKGISLTPDLSPAR